MHHSEETFDLFCNEDMGELNFTKPNEDNMAEEDLTIDFGEFDDLFDGTFEAFLDSAMVEEKPKTPPPDFLDINRMLSFIPREETQIKSSKNPCLERFYATKKARQKNGFDSFKMQKNYVENCNNHPSVFVGLNVDSFFTNNLNEVQKVKVIDCYRCCYSDKVLNQLFSNISKFTLLQMIMETLINPLESEYSINYFLYSPLIHDKCLLILKEAGFENVKLENNWHLLQACFFVASLGKQNEEIYQIEVFIDFHILPSTDKLLFITGSLAEGLVSETFIKGTINAHGFERLSRKVTKQIRVILTFNKQDVVSLLSRNYNKTIDSFNYGIQFRSMNLVQ